MKSETRIQSPLIKITSSDMTAPDTLFDKLVTKKQLSELLAVSASFINKLMKSEGLPHRKFGRAVRFSAKEVMAWLQNRSRP